jgi:hypothetical protein|tara:strand:- start:442 stop:636 length:195 start_codon:yes stop_codon:yes gene_type:complete
MQRLISQFVLDVVVEDRHLDRSEGRLRIRVSSTTRFQKAALLVGVEHEDESTRRSKDEQGDGDK